MQRTDVDADTGRHVVKRHMVEPLASVDHDGRGAAGPDGVVTPGAAQFVGPTAPDQFVVGAVALQIVGRLIAPDDVWVFSPADVLDVGEAVDALADCGARDEVDGDRERRAGEDREVGPRSPGRQIVAGSGIETVVTGLTV